MNKAIAAFLLCLLCIGCATYYQKNKKFHDLFISGEISKADELLANDKKAGKGKNQLLYEMNRGVTNQLLGNFEQSNRHLAEADRIAEVYRKNYAKQLVSYLSNPMVLPYKAEDFELVMINYYLAINYLKLGELDEALVEARRINLKLQQLNDKYKKKNRYKTDAFAINLSGILYDMEGDYNNAFIAYRNAYEAYVEDYKPLFGVGVPEQLKQDLLRSAYRIGFFEELEQYEEEFGTQYEPQKNEGGELVFFWQNGLGPIKAEWSINFAVVKGAGGLITFANEEENMSFPFFLSGNESENEKNGLGQLKVIRVAFPKYVARYPFYSEGRIKVAARSYPLQEAQNINQIAFKVLEDRMLREFANALLRLALKQAVEISVRQESEGLGALVGVFNALTEKADTRNWQTLPYQICYSRIPLPAGQHKLDLITLSKVDNSERTQEITINIKRGQTSVYTFHSMETVRSGAY